MVAATYRVLVVDDEALVRRAAARSLTDEGFFCEVAEDGEEAITLVNAQEFDVIVTDLRMPHKHGHALAVELLERDDSPLIIVVTGVAEPKLARDLTTRGVDKVCFKPVDYAELASDVRALLRRRATTSQIALGQSDAESSAPAKGITQGLPVVGALSSMGPGTTKSPLAHAVVSPTKQMVMILINNQECSQQLAHRLCSERIEAIVTSGSDDLCRLLNHQHVDLVIVEQKLEGFVSGLEILSRLCKGPLPPETILLAEPSNEIREQADPLGIDTVLNSESHLDDIVATVQSLLNSSKVGGTIIPRRACKLVQQYDDIAPLPQLVVKLLTYLEMELTDIPLTELARDISVDAKATAQLLTLTNSASVGLSRDITRVLDAVNLLGAKRAISLIVSSAVLMAQSELLKDWSEPLREWYQRRSVLIASTASTFAERMEKISPDTAFLMGLLQEIGILVLANSAKERYLQTVIQRAQKIGQLQLHVVEQEAYQMTHAEVSAALLQKWELPQSVVQTVLDHHCPDRIAEKSTTDQKFLRAMRIAEAFADLTDLSHPSRRCALNRLLDEYGSREANECKTCLDDSVAKTAEFCELFSMPVPDLSTLEAAILEVTSSEPTPTRTTVKSVARLRL